MTHQRRFEDKVCLVTGGASGIGRAAVRAFAAEGARVAFCDLQADAGADLAAELTAAGHQAAFFRTDLERPEEIAEFVDGAVAHFGGLDVAFNNAGVNFFRRLDEIELEDWDRMFRINTRAVFLCIKHQAPHMIHRGGGAIVITGSAIQEASRPGGAAYAASKRAVLGIAQSAALDYGSLGVRVNVLSPGTTDTPMARTVGARAIGAEAWAERSAAWAKANIPAAKRLATAEEMAALALFLASEDCRFLNGVSLLADGGMTALLS